MDQESTTFEVLRSISPCEIERLEDLGVDDVIERIQEALAPDFGEEKAWDIGFHLSDWISQAAFLVALHLRPEAFSLKDISQEVYDLTFHAPNHLNAASHLMGAPLTDTWDIGVQVGPSNAAAEPSV